MNKILLGFLTLAFILFFSFSVSPVYAQTSPPSLVLHEVVINNNGGTAVASDWILSAFGPTAISGNGPTVASNSFFSAGEYTLHEDGPLGYDIGNGWVCIGGTQGPIPNHITVNTGESADCTITNDDIPPKLTLVKNVINDNSGTSIASNWILNANGPTPISGAGGVISDNTFSAGTYSLSESTGPIGYQASQWVCVGGSQAGDSVSLALGESATCTVTNDDLALIGPPTDKDQCKDDRWQTFNNPTFKNQGQCVSYVERQN